MAGEGRRRRRVHIGTYVYEEELERVIDREWWNFLKLSEGVFRLFLGGALRALELRLEEEGDPVKKREIERNIDQIRTLL